GADSGTVDRAAASTRQHLVPPAPGPRLGLGWEPGNREGLRARLRVAVPPAPAARRECDRLAESRPARDDGVRGRAARRPADRPAGQPLGACRARRRAHRVNGGYGSTGSLIWSTPPRLMNGWSPSSAAARAASSASITDQPVMGPCAGPSFVPELEIVDVESTGAPGSTSAWPVFAAHCM